MVKSIPAKTVVTPPAKVSVPAKIEVKKIPVKTTIPTKTAVAVVPAKTEEVQVPAKIETAKKVEVKKPAIVVSRIPKPQSPSGIPKPNPVKKS